MKSRKGSATWLSSSGGSDGRRDAKGSGVKEACCVRRFHGKESADFVEPVYDIKPYRI